MDVSNEMAAVNRDIEALLQGYESIFYKPRRSKNSRKNHYEEESSEDIRRKKCEDQSFLTEEQIRILSMDKPPLEKLKEVPLKFLKPRPPVSMRVKFN